MDMHMHCGTRHGPNYCPTFSRTNNL